MTSSIILFQRRGHFEQLFYGGKTGCDLFSAIDDEGLHAFAVGLRSQFRQISIGQDTFFQLIADGQHFIDAATAAIAGMAAFLAADGDIFLFWLGDLPRADQPCPFFITNGYWLLAQCAQRAHQALCHDAKDSGLDQVGGYAQVQ